MRFRVQILHVRPDNHEIHSQYNPERTYGKYQPISLRAAVKRSLHLIEKGNVVVLFNDEYKVYKASLKEFVNGHGGTWF